MASRDFITAIIVFSKMNKIYPMLFFCCCREDIIGLYLLNICDTNSGNIKKKTLKNTAEKFLRLGRQLSHILTCTHIYVKKCAGRNTNTENKQNLVLRKRMCQ